MKLIHFGTKSVVVNKVDLTGKIIERWNVDRIPESVKRKTMVYKISINGNEYNKETKNAALLNIFDPEQKNFVYPIQGYILDANPALMKYLADLNPLLNNVGKSNFINSKRMYVEVMPDAGKSLYKLKQEKVALNSNQAREAIDQLLKGICLLHGKNIKHGDLHEHNIAIDIAPNGDVRLRIIDFGEMKEKDINDHYDNMQKDAQNVKGLVIDIGSLVRGPRDKRLAAFLSTLDKGTTNMNALSICISFDKAMRASPPPHKEPSPNQNYKRRRRDSFSASSSSSIRRSPRKALFQQMQMPDVPQHSNSQSHSRSRSGSRTPSGPRIAVFQQMQMPDVPHSSSHSRNHSRTSSSSSTARRK